MAKRVDPMHGIRRPPDHEQEQADGRQNGHRDAESGVVQAKTLAFQAQPADGRGNDQRGDDQPPAEQAVDPRAGEDTPEPDGRRGDERRTHNQQPMVASRVMRFAPLSTWGPTAPYRMSSRLRTAMVAIGHANPAIGQPNAVARSIDDALRQASNKANAAMGSSDRETGRRDACRGQVDGQMPACEILRDAEAGQTADNGRAER